MKYILILFALLLTACPSRMDGDTIIYPPGGMVVYNCHSTGELHIKTSSVDCPGMLYFCIVRTNEVIWSRLGHTIMGRCNNGDLYYNLKDVQFKNIQYEPKEE